MLLCLLVMPVALLASTSSPAAAVGYGPSIPGDTLDFEVAGSDPDPGDGLHVRCGINAQWAVDWASGPGIPAFSQVARTVIAKVHCDTGWNVSSVQLGISVEGSGCYLAGHLGEMDGTGTKTATLGATSAGNCTGPVSPAPTITQWCGLATIDFHAAGGLENEVTLDTCGGLPMGNPPIPPTNTSCIFGTPATPDPGSGLLHGPDGNNKYAEIVDGTFAMAAGSQVDDVGTWYAYFVTDNTPGGGGASGSNTSNRTVANIVSATGGGTANMYSTANPVLYSLAKRASWNITNDPADLGTPFNRTRFVVTTHAGTVSERAANPYPPNQVLGMGMYRINTATSNTGTGTTSTTNHQNAGSDYPTSLTAGLVGKSAPSACAFYWGAKLYEAAGTTTDDPLGPLDPVPETPPDLPDPEVPPGDPRDCSFSWTDPTTWATGGICEIVRQLIKIAAAITGLAAAIAAAIVGAFAGVVDAILDGLEALFIPDQAKLREDLQRVKTAWEDSPPMVLIGSVGDVAEAVEVPAPSGCQGPALTFPRPTGGTSTVYPLAACAGSVATVATIVKAGLTALVFLGGFMVAVRIVGSAFGLQLSFGRGDDS